MLALAHPNTVKLHEDSLPALIVTHLMCVKPGLVTSPGMITLVQSPSPIGNDASGGCREENESW